MTLPSIDKIREMDKILKKRREDLKTSDPERYKLLAEIDQKMLENLETMLENLETAASQND